jgi:predicted nucleotidyltransferase
MDEKNEEGKLRLKGYDAAYRFAKNAFERYPKLIKTITLFGSYSKGKETEQSDVDIMIIMDDVLNKIDENILAPFYADVDKLLKEEKSVKLHINFVTLTAFWKGVLAADPVSINVLKYGVPLIDTGYFEPLQVLLERGEIKPTEESIYAALSRSQLYAESSKVRLAGSITDMYWSIINSAQAIIMKHGEVPPSPETISGMLESLERMHLVTSEDVSTFTQIFSLGKKLLHGERLEITGEDADKVINAGMHFNDKMNRLIEKD